MALYQNGMFDLKSDNPSETTNGDTSTFTTIKFPTPFPADAKVIVLAQTQTFNGKETPGIRIADVSPTGFKIRFNELVAHSGALSDGKHLTETVGWAAYSV